MATDPRHAAGLSIPSGLENSGTHITTQEAKMHHKRKRSKNARAGCLLCKPNKMNGWAKHRALGHVGFGKLRREIVALDALKESYS